MSKYNGKDPSAENDLSIIYGDQLPYRESRCNICTSAHRTRIDRLIALGLADTEIAEDILLTCDDFKGKSQGTVRKNVERHRKKHFNARDRALRKIVEKRALEAGIIVEEAEGSIVTPRAVLDAMIQRGYEQITDPESRIKYDPVVDAIRLVEDQQRSEYQAQVETMNRQVWAISQAIREIVPAHLYPQLKECAHQLFENPMIERVVPEPKKKELEE